MVKRFACAAAGVLLAASVGYAGSVDTFGIGSRATALGGAYAATADDPFAVYYNPAGLSQIDGKVFSLGAHVVDPTIKMSNYEVKNCTDGSVLIPSADFEDESDILIAPHMGYAQKINDSFALGVAAYAPWGMELEWEKDPAKNPGSYSAYHSYYKRYGVTPSLSYKVNDKLAFGVGVTIGKSEAGAEANKYVTPDMQAFAKDVVFKASIANQKYKFVDSGNPITTTADAATVYNILYASTGEKKYKDAADMMQGFNGAGITNVAVIEAAIPAAASPDHNVPIGMELEDDINYSYNIGVMYKPKETITIGVTYRSECDADFEGDVFMDGAKVTTATMDYNHPQQIQAGVRYQPHVNFSIECDLVWTDWSINKHQTSKLADPITVDVIPPGVTISKEEELFPREWEDTKQLRFGMEYIVNDMVTVRGGYFYDPTPIPDNTLDMQWPDADKKTYSLGAGFNFGRYTIDTVVQYTDIEKARMVGGESENLNHSIPNGNVSASADGYILGAGVTLTARF